MHEFKKDSRLLKPADYKKAFDLGDKKHLPEFLVVYIKNELSHPRLGLAISKKNIKLAHKRNTIKRLIRESFRLSSIDNYDYVIVSRAKISLSNNKELRKVLDNIWIK